MGSDLVDAVYPDKAEQDVLVFELSIDSKGDIRIEIPASSIE